VSWSGWGVGKGWWGGERTVNANEENGHVRPGETEDVELELVHVGCFAVKEEEEAEYGGFGASLPAVDWVLEHC